MTVAVFIFVLIAGNLTCGDTVAGISTQRSSVRSVLMILKLILIPANSMKKIPINTINKKALFLGRAFSFMVGQDRIELSTLGFSVHQTRIGKTAIILKNPVMSKS